MPSRLSLLSSIAKAKLEFEHVVCGWEIKIVTNGQRRSIGGRSMGVVGARWLVSSTVTLYCTGVLGRWVVNGNSCLAPLVESEQ